MKTCYKCNREVKGNVDQKAMVLCWLCTARKLPKYAKLAEAADQRCQDRLVNRRLNKFNGGKR